MSLRHQKKCPCPGSPRAKAHTRTDCPQYRSKPLGEFTPEEHAARQCFAIRDENGLTIDLTGVTLDDLEDDFEAGVKAMADDAMAMHNSIPPHLRRRYYMRSSCEHMIAMLDVERPIEMFIDMACQRIIRNAELLRAEIPEESRWVEPEKEA